LATVIDSLLIELGLDTSKFNDAQKKAVESLKKTDEQAKKSNDVIQRGAKQTADEFSKAKDSIVALGTALLSFDAVKSFVMDMTKSNMQLGISSSLLNVSARQLKSWSEVAQKAGAAPETFTNAMKTMQEQAALFHMGKGGQEFAQSFSMLGLDKDKDITNIGKISDALIKFRDKFGTREAQNLAKTLGFGDDASFNAMLKGGDALNSLYKDMDKYNDKSEQATIEAGKLNDKMVDLSSAFGRLKDQTYISIGPGLEELLDFAKDAVTWFTKLSDIIDKFESKLGMSSVQKVLSRAMPIAGVAIAAYNEVTGKAAKAQKQSATQEKNSKQLMDYFVSQGWTKEQAAGIIGNLSQESKLDPNAKNASGMKGIAQWNKSRQADFQKWAGFAIDDPKADLMKQAAFIQYELTQGSEKNAGNKLKQQNTAIGASDVIMGSYERPNDNSASKREQYAIQAANMTGAGINAHTNNTSTANNTQVAINGDINVHTQATDANGIAKELPQAIQNQSMINAGMGANR